MTSEQELHELVGFLGGGSSTQVRTQALDIVVGLTGTQDGIDTLMKVKDPLLKQLLALVGDETKLGEGATKALVNLLASAGIIDVLLSKGVVERCMSALDDSSCKYKGYCVMLLANATQTEEGVNKLLQHEKGSVSGLLLGKLVQFLDKPDEGKGSDASVSGISSDDSNDEFKHVATVLNNVSNFEQGRTLLTDKDGLAYALPALSYQIRTARHPERREGAISAFRNCCFDAEKWVDSVPEPGGLFEPLLLALSSPQAPSIEDAAKMPPTLAYALMATGRKREHDPAIRLAAAEALLLLVQTETGRKTLFDLQCSSILNGGYKEEEDEHIMNVIEQIHSAFF
mmetsp:Transcript_676/g.2472  ORF Transcript_676/g.2472 Transcript_676/m.2472 type:complete len:342 (-) Transcript_676:55-1080(-)